MSSNNAHDALSCESHARASDSPLGIVHRRLWEDVHSLLEQVNASFRNSILLSIHEIIYQLPDAAVEQLQVRRSRLVCHSMHLGITIFKV